MVLWLHTKSKHEGKKYDCKVCEKSFSSKGNLSQHITSVHLNENHLCGICSYKTTRKNHLTRHIQYVHQNHKEICNVCNRSVKHLAKHMIFSHSKKNFEYSCSICSFKTIYKSYLKEHGKQVHLNIKRKHKKKNMNYFKIKQSQLVISPSNTQSK